MYIHTEIWKAGRMNTVDLYPGETPIHQDQLLNLSTLTTFAITPPLTITPVTSLCEGSLLLHRWNGFLC